MYSSRGQAALFLLIAASLFASLISCAAPEQVHRFAVLRFENLSPSAPDSDWIGRAISEEIAGQLEGTRHSAVVSFAAIHRIDNALGARPVGAPGVSTELSAARAAGANRIVTGFYTLRGGRLAISASVEILPGGKQQSVFSGSGTLEDLLHFCDEAARKIDDEARPPITGSPRALRSYSRGLEAPSGRETPLFAEAIQLDPDFGPPYVALAQIAFAKHDSAAFSNVFTAARTRGSAIGAVDRAILNLDDAEMHATPAARVDALAALVRITPADPFHLRELADAELQINRYAEAADHYRRLATLMPADPEPVNRLGYALLYARDELAAMKAFQDFRRLDHDSANSLDSTGDAHFFFNHFADAERDYLAAYERDPELSEGTELIKAAWARLMRNDATSTTALLERYLKDRSNDALAPLRAAQIEQLAGHRERAKKLLAPYLASPIPAVRNAATTQLAVFGLFDQPPRPASLDAPLGPAVNALLAKDYAQAVPLWRKLAEESSPSDWWARTIYARALAESGQSQESERYARFTPIPQPTRGVSFDQLWYPWILAARK